MIGRVFPIIVIFLCMAASGVYAWQGDYKSSMLWAGFTIADIASIL